jgi:GPH family glycoside/pentoside/hexuronide:cation symporter
LAYALGNPAHQIAETVILTLVLYFYLPPGGRGLAPQVSQEVFFGGLTVFGLAMIVGRVFDGLSDPLVGHLSDRSRSRFGRRRSFMAAGLPGLALLPALLFWPLGAAGSATNGWFLAAGLSLFFVAFTIFTAPYLALIPEIATGDRERVDLTTLIGVVTFVFLVFYNVAWPAGIELGRSLGLETPGAVRLVAVLSAALVLALGAVAVAGVDERRLVHTVPPELGFRQAVAQTLRCTPFLIYLAGQIFFYFAVSVVRPSIVYFATVVLERGEGVAALLGAPAAITAPLGFVTFRAVAKRYGARRAIVLCNLLFAAATAPLGLLTPDAPGGPRDALNLGIVLAATSGLGFASAGFMVLPLVVISQVVDFDALRTGANRAAIFFGVQGFATKGVIGLASATLAFLFARFGNSVDSPLGVVLIGPVAAAGALVAALFYSLYPERRVLAAVGAAADADAAAVDADTAAAERSD